MLALLLTVGAAFPQETEENFTVPGEPPFLLLRPQRLRLLRRERERRSARWEQFHRLVAGGAAMPEPGFALALDYRVSDNAASGRRAVEWVAGPGADVRQLALVYDWCGPLLSEAEGSALAGKLRRALAAAPAGLRVSEARDRALAAVALARVDPDLSRRELRRLVQEWWRGGIVPAIRKGNNALPRSESYALFEALHAIRDSLDIDLREDLNRFFREMPALCLLSYYPASYPQPENEYRIPSVKGAEPDLKLATMSRAAELAMAAFDVNLQENQFVQGWLMHDRFALRTPLGSPYEFLWANPYHPGLSYYSLPLAAHDKTLGRVYLRSSWRDDAEWLGYFEGQLQTFSNGEPRILPVRAVARPMRFAEAAAVSAARFQVAEEVKTVYVVGLASSQDYRVEPDFHEMHEARTDPGGVLEIVFPNGFHGAIRVAAIQP